MDWHRTHGRRIMESRSLGYEDAASALDQQIAIVCVLGHDAFADTGRPTDTSIQTRRSNISGLL